MNARHGSAIAALLACAACAAAAAAFGPDANFDLRNYHLYVAWAWLEGRAATDVAAAQAQTWFNPLLWVPHWLAFERLGGAALAALLGALQGLCAVPLLALARRLLPDASFALQWGGAAAGLGAATFIGQLGASYGDTLLAGLALCGVVLAHDAADRPRVDPRRALVAGTLLGAVAALKLSHAPVALGLCLALPVLARDGAARARLVGWTAVGALAAFAALGGPWAWALWQAWGNPVFPQFDVLFGGDWIAPDAARDLRFVPAGVGEALLRPMAPLFDWRATSDYRIRDARLPLLFVALALLAWRPRRERGPSRALAAYLGLAAGLAYAVWLPLFGYHRYLVALEMFAPLLLLAACAPGAARRVALAAVVVAALATNPPNHERAARDWPPRAPLAAPVDLPPDAMLVLAGVAPTAHALPLLPPFAAAVRVDGNLHGLGRPPARLDALAVARIRIHDGPLRLLADPRELARADRALAGIGLARAKGDGQAIELPLRADGDPALRLYALLAAETGPRPR